MTDDLKAEWVLHSMCSFSSKFSGVRKHLVESFMCDLHFIDGMRSTRFLIWRNTRKACAC